LAELDAAGIRLYCDGEGIDSSTPLSRAMIQMASIFGEQERSILRVMAGLERVRQQGKRLGHPEDSSEGRGRHQEAPERREWHTGGRPDRRLRWRDGSAGEHGDICLMVDAA
jgi:DNA invertase Pin-like site-specific DNA recombinase